MLGALLATGGAAVSRADHALPLGGVQSWESPAFQLNPAASCYSSSGIKQKDGVLSVQRSQCLHKINKWMNTRCVLKVPTRKTCCHSAFQAAG